MKALVGQCACVVAAFMVTATVFAMTSGLLAVFLVHFTGSSLTVATIQGIVAVYALVVALAAVPVFFHALFMCFCVKADMRTWLRRSRKSLKASYPRLIVSLLASLVLGLFVSLAFDRLPQTAPLFVIERIVLVAVGVAAIYAMYRGYRQGRKNTWRPGSSGSKKQDLLIAKGPKQPAHFAPYESALYSPQPDFSLFTEGQARRSHKAMRATLALIIFLSSMPSVWLYMFRDTQPAYAQELGSTPLSQSGTPNSYQGQGGNNQGQGQDPAFLKSPSIEEEPTPPVGAVEEVSHDRYSTTWANRDGTFTTRIQNEPLTYTDDTGAERDIDNTLVPSQNGLTNADNDYSVTLPASGGGMTLEKDGYTLESTPLFGTLKDAVAKENAVLYNNVADGVDIQYTAYGSEVKEDIILNRPSSIGSFDYQLTAEGIVFTLQDNTVLGFAAEDADNPDALPVFIIDAPLMTDASGATSINIKLALTPTEGGATLSIVPDADWLSAPERAWPVVIDPTHALGGTNLMQGTIQDFLGPSSGPDMEHDVSYLYVGLEDGSLVGVPPITYGESWSYIKINDITPYVTDLPDNAILSASLCAYKYGTIQNGAGAGLPIDAKMIALDWGGDGRHTWNNRPLGAGLTYLDTQYTPAYQGWMNFDITDAFKAWQRDPSTNLGIMLTPESEVQPAVSFSGTGNAHGLQALYLDLSWTVPNPVDEGLALDAPNVNLRPLTYKNPIGYQNFVGLSADGIVRPALQVDYLLGMQVGGFYLAIDGGTYDKAEYEPIYPDTTLFEDQLAFTLGYYGLYESNWQTGLFPGNEFSFDTLYQVAAFGTRVYDVWMNPDDVFEQTPMGYSDNFIIYQLKDQDTLPYVAAYYGVSRNQIALDNRVGDDLVLPGNTIFIRNPNANATIPYTRPDNLTLEQKRSIIYANMGRSQTSEFDMEPVNMSTGDFYLEQTDATSAEYSGEFTITRSYNSLAPQTSGAFGRGWASPFQQALVGSIDGSITYIADDGRELVFAKTDDGWASPAGYSLNLEKHDGEDPADTTYTITKLDGTVLSFDCYGALVSITSAAGFQTCVNYDSLGQMSSITTETGRTYQVTTDGAGHIASITEPGGAVLRYTYDSEGYLASATDADGATVSYEYDSNGQMSAWYDGDGNRVVANTFDDQGRVIEQTDALGNTSSVEYADGATTLTDASGVQTVYGYNDLYQATSVERAGVTTYKSYNAAGQLASSTDGLGRTTTYTYDAAGNLATTTRCDGSYQEISYDSCARPVTVRDFDGAVTLNTYDGAGNLVSRANPDGTSLAYTYDAFGRMTTLTDELGNTTAFVWDGISTLATTDPLGNTSMTYYDAMGRPIDEVDALGNEVKTIYSPGGKTTGIWESGGSSINYAFDGAGRCVAITDRLGTTSSYAYDAAGNLISASAPEGSSVSYTYDEAGDKTSQTDSLGNTTWYTYDAWGNLTATTDALGNTEYRSWDAANRLISVSDALGNTTTYQYEGAIDQPTETDSPAGVATDTYDACGRVLEVCLPDGTFSRYAYDLRGNVASEENEAGLVTTYTYDAAGNLIEKSDSGGRVERSAYDAAGNLVSFTDAEGRQTAYAYDAARRPVEITAPGWLVSELA
ncbi:MAG: DUF6531 domain-containing protein, partial [Eggerthellaceae bacterium]|nr:DUF6531 domain-containing protein [Eggerthellaceae bacterium]